MQPESGSVPGSVELSAPEVSASRSLAAIPGRAVGWYLLVAVIWIVATDLAVGAFEDEPMRDQAADVAKGLAFVTVSALVLWVVLRRLTRSFERLFVGTVTAQRDFYQSVLRTSSDLIVICGTDGTVRYVNDAVTTLLGWRSQDMVGRPNRDFLHPGDRAAAATFRENVESAGHRPGSRRTFRLLAEDGSYRAVEITSAPLTLDGGRPGVLLNGRDVTDRARSEQQLRAALAEDVTGLPNLRMFVAEMERLDEPDLNSLAALVVLVDVDRFGDINALHGRMGGDAVLLELARRLESTMPEALGMWRHGADEILAVVLDGEAGAGGAGLDATELVDRIQRAASAPIAIDERERRVSVNVSVGVARIGLHGRPAEEPLSTVMLRPAEQALAEAKRHPDRSCIHLLDDPSEAYEDRARVVAALQEAIDRGDLVAHYQPKVRLDDLATAGAEALVRWNHPERGLLLPGQFLRSVEDANLTAALTRVVLRDSLARVPGWLATPGCDPDFTLCVNISLDDLRRRRFIDDVFEALDEAGVEPHRLCLELTEQTMLADTLGARNVVDELRRAGIEIAIDDFGTGYSSLEHIRVFEVDALKVDKGFVQRIGQSRTDEAIVDSIIAIAGRLGVRVTAEGIEDVGVLEYLRERSCGLGQGFLFSKAVPAEDFDAAARWESVV